MRQVSVVIPNYNGLHFLKNCLDTVFAQKGTESQEVIVVDNGSADGSVEFLKKYPQVRVISLEENFGFCRAVNEGIKAAQSEYVILLNNDTEVEPEFASELLRAVKSDEKIFSCSSKMIQYTDREKMDDAGDYFCALGWAFGRGKGAPVSDYEEPADVFAACGGASIYRKDVIEALGYFDENHFAYLEDIDIGYRARIFGYRNVYAPKAVVYHVGSGSSGSVYNEFKVNLSSRNSIFLIYKNMPFLQIVINSPFLILGFFIKWLFFVRKGLGGVYRRGLANGVRQCRNLTRVKFRWKNLGHYGKIQLELWVNLWRRLKRN
ncbi:MAG: glycosyltransferase family 2 protein [Lachnospiraceae bacterium]